MFVQLTKNILPFYNVRRHSSEESLVTSNNERISPFRFLRATDTWEVTHVEEGEISLSLIIISDRKLGAKVQESLIERFAFGFSYPNALNFIYSHSFFFKCVMAMCVIYVHANALLLFPCDIKCATVLAVSLPEEISCGLIPVACIEIFYK